MEIIRAVKIMIQFLPTILFLGIAMLIKPRNRKKIEILPPEIPEKVQLNRPDARETIQGFWTCEKCQNTFLALGMHDIETHVCRKVTV